MVQLQGLEKSASRQWQNHLEMESTGGFEDELAIDSYVFCIIYIFW